MNYEQFKISAKRHLVTCESLIQKQNRGNRKQIIQETYYLSGYVLETLLSYAFCSKLKLKGDVNKNVLFKNSQFKTHNLNSKVSYAKQYSCRLNDIVFFTKPCQNKKLQEMYNDWSVNYRYEQYPKNIQISDMKLYIKELKSIYKTILTRYPL